MKQVIILAMLAISTVQAYDLQQAIKHNMQSSYNYWADAIDNNNRIEKECAKKLNQLKQSSKQKNFKLFLENAKLKKQLANQQKYGWV